MTEESERLCRTIVDHFREPIGVVQIEKELWNLRNAISSEDRVEFTWAVYSEFIRAESWHQNARLLFRGLSCIDKSENTKRRNDFKERFHPDGAQAREKRKRIADVNRRALASCERKRKADSLRILKEKEDLMRAVAAKMERESRKAALEFYNSPEQIELRRIERAQQKAELEFYNSPEQIELRRIKALHDQMRSEVQEILYSANQQNSLIHGSRPSEQDIQLAEIWANGDDKDSTMAMMLSARLAEVAISDYFTSEGYKVEDIALTQVLAPEDDWKLYDLRVNNGHQELLIDVKNARRSEHNKMSYTSHCVPKFKQKKHRNDSIYANHGVPVIIAGCLSDYQKLDDIKYRPKGVQFLGMTQISTLNDVTLEFSGDRFSVNFIPPVTSAGETRKTLLPPWVFEFSSDSYKERDELIAGIDIQKYKDLTHDSCYIALWLAMRMSNEEASLSTKSHDNNFIVSLGDRIKRHGLSLPILFCTILEHFICSIRSMDSEQEFDSKLISSVLYPSRDQDKTTPLFIFDPTETIAGLLNSLGILWRNRHEEELSSIKEFKLQNFNILKGKKRADSYDSPWLTLLAYCGGWHEDRKRPCGNTPLVIGECRHCKRGYLICPECGYCCESCKKEID